ncbi:unnamed protein product [Phytophthora lilii]|uniref:Unnamed protein product n=1 Tax=Phytophthora lilii TaxID=2077276 RepID=A0A9W6TTM2_9STRA|nr:unnamed protein product [Phytophthora lilii]
MACGKFYVQSCGLFWYIHNYECVVAECVVILTWCVFKLFRLLSTVYLVQTALPAFICAKRPTQAVFSLIIHRPRIAGGNLTIPIDAAVRLVKCSRREAAYNTIRLRYGETRKCLILRASNSLEREKWLVGIIQSIAAAQDLDNAPTSCLYENTANVSLSSRQTRRAMARQSIDAAQPSKAKSAEHIDPANKLAAKLSRSMLQLPFSYPEDAATNKEITLTHYI